MIAMPSPAPISRGTKRGASAAAPAAMAQDMSPTRTYPRTAVVKKGPTAQEKLFTWNVLTDYEKGAKKREAGQNAIRVSASAIVTAAFILAFF